MALGLQVGLKTQVLSHLLNSDGHFPLGVLAKVPYDLNAESCCLADAETRTYAYSKLYTRNPQLKTLSPKT